MEKRPIAPNAPYVPHPSQIIHQDPSQSDLPPSYQNLYNVPQPQPPVNNYHHQQVPAPSHIGFQVPITQQPQTVHTQSKFMSHCIFYTIMTCDVACVLLLNVNYDNNLRFDFRCSPSESWYQSS